MEAASRVVSILSLARASYLAVQHNDMVTPDKMGNFLASQLTSAGLVNPLRSRRYTLIDHRKDWRRTSL